MGILCDLFVSTQEMALKYEAMMHDEEPLDAFVRAEYKGLTSLEFGTLWALILQNKFDFKTHALVELSSGESSWLNQFPVEYVKALASLDPAALTRVAAAWAATEELQWPPEEAEEVLVELARLARLAVSTGRGLYHWGSL